MAELQQVDSNFFVYIIRSIAAVLSIYVYTNAAKQ